MDIKFKTSESGYFDYVMQYSRKSKVGKSARKKFYIGFTLIFILVCTVASYYVIVNNMIPIPFFIMFAIIYVVSMFYMMFIDVNSMGAIRKAKKILKTQPAHYGEQVYIKIDKSQIDISDKSSKKNYAIAEISGYAESKEFFTLFISEVKGYSIPKSSFNNEKLMNDFRTLFKKL